MRYRGLLSIVVILAALVLIPGNSTGILRKPKTKVITIRGPMGVFTIGSVMCGSKTCTRYSGARTGMNISGLGRGASLNWEIIRGDQAFATPNGGIAYAIDGDATIQLQDVAQSKLNMLFGGPDILVVNTTADRALGKFAAALSGTGVFADATGIADVSMVLDLIADTVEWELDGNYTD
jgi:hypothetical protein